jgi:DNA-binding MurR/RpiR family transcriptional regulator
MAEKNDKDNALDFDDLYKTGTHHGIVRELKDFSPFNTLLQIFNQAPASSTAGIISKYFLEHFYELDRLNIYDVARECYTSRSGIRRFVQSVGFDNFSSLKGDTWEWHLRRKYFTDYVDHDNFREYLTSEVANMFENINQQIDDATLDQLAARLRASEQPLLLSSDYSAMAVREFQQSMLVLNKLVRVVTDSDGDLSILNALTPHDVIIVISGSGNFVQSVEKTIRPGTNGYKVIVTLNPAFEASDLFDSCICLSHAEYHRVRTAYSEYGIRYFFDLLYNRYFLRYGKNTAE